MCLLIHIKLNPKISKEKNNFMAGELKSQELHRGESGGKARSFEFS